MKDQFERVVNYLRLSVTDRCNLRCFYCRGQKDFKLLNKSQILKFEEILKLVYLFVDTGIRKIRITGGEPLVRKEIVSLIKEIRAIREIQRLTLTTNGVLLGKFSGLLKDARVDQINISLDTMDAQKFYNISKGDLSIVLDSIIKAKQAGLEVKINTVLSRHNFDEYQSLLTFASQHYLLIRFIELMPFDATWQEEFVSINELKGEIEKRWRLEKIHGLHKSGPAEYYKCEALNIVIGFISPISKKFCQDCNRIRLTADGHLIPCLGYDTSYNLRDLIRSKASDSSIVDVIKTAIYNKPQAHQMPEEIPHRVMQEIGG